MQVTFNSINKCVFFSLNQPEPYRCAVPTQVAKGSQPRTHQRALDQGGGPEGKRIKYFVADIRDNDNILNIDPCCLKAIKDSSHLLLYKLV